MQRKLSIVHGLWQDIPAILTLHNLANPYDQWDLSRLEMIFEYQVPVLLLKKDEQLLGVLIYLVCLDEVRVINFTIHPNHRRQGLASYLFSYLTGVMQQNNWKYALLDVRSQNDGALQFYQQLGFSILCRRNNFYHHNEFHDDGYLMQYELANANALGAY